MRSAAPRLGLVLAGLLAFLPLCSRAKAAGSHVAPLLFLAADGPLPSYLNVAAFHQGGWDRLLTAVQGRGSEVVPRPTLEPLLFRWRVRTSADAGSGLLAFLADTLGADRVFIVDVTVHWDRLLLSGRSTRTDSGNLLWVGSVEGRVPRKAGQDSGGSTNAWLEALGAALTKLVAEWVERPQDESALGLCVLPVRRAEVDDITANLVTHCLLRSVLAAGWLVQDPGVTASRLRDAGADPAQCDRRARGVLAGADSTGLLLICLVAAYEEASASGPLSAEEEELPVIPEIRMPPSTLTVRLVDGRTGEVRYAATEYFGAKQSRGFFGLARSPSPQAQLQPVTDRLVPAAQPRG